MTKLRVAFFLPSLGGGGAERVAVTLANQLSNRGIEVEIVLASAEGPYLKDVDPSVKIVDLASKRVMLSLGRLVRYIRNSRPDVVLSHLNYANIVALLASKFAHTGTRVYVVEHASIEKYFERASLKKRIIRQLMKRLYPAADGVIAVSDRIRSELINECGIAAEKAYTIYNPIVRPEIAVLAAQPVSEIEALPRPLILGVGRLTRQKAFDNLLRAFALISQKRPAQLVILGEGEERANLEALAQSLGIADRVLMAGFVENPYSWMSQADLFVLSSEFEGLPTVLVEAMACGTPVVSTDCLTGPSEILEQGKWGRMVPINDFEMLSKAILDTLNDTHHPSVRDRAERFSVSNSSLRYISLLLGTG